MTVLEVVLFAVGYPVSITVIVRWIPVVRERRIRWFVAHELAVAAIVTGWALRGDPGAVAINATWLVVAAAWYGLGGRRRRSGTPGMRHPGS
ncbi:MAG: hypothetical protein ACXW1S_04325 [Acidimicrobiia bacterium]